MFSHIRSSKENKELITKLTREHNLGAENIIARLAIGTSLGSGVKLDLQNIANSSGKEYSRKVLLGEYDDYYIALIASHYNLHISHPDIGKYLKMHLDDGVNLISLNGI